MKRGRPWADDPGPQRKRYKTLVIRRRSPPLTRCFSRQQEAARALQRFWRVSGRLRPMNNVEEHGRAGFVRRGGKNVLCPITQDCIRVGYSFKFVTSSGHVVCYSMPDLVEYFRTTGNFSDPCTREPWNEAQVLRLHELALRRGFQGSAFLCGIFHMRESLQRAQTERQNRLLAIENTCGAVMTECIDLCADLNTTSDEAEHLLCHTLLPEWAQLVDDFARFSMHSCKIMLHCDREKLLRLERSGIADPHLLVRSVKHAVELKIRQLEGEELRSHHRELAFERIRQRLLETFRSDGRSLILWGLPPSS